MDFNDPDISLADKVKFYQQEENNDLIEQIIFAYEDTPLADTFDLLFELSISPSVNATIKYNIFSSLISFTEGEDRNKIESALAAFIPPNLMLEIPVIGWLFSFENGEDKHLIRLYKYLSNEKLADKTKYEQLRSLIAKGYTKAGMLGMEFLTHQKISSRITIMCGQYLLQENYPETKFVVERMFEIAQDEKMDYNTRADAADALHHYLRGEMQDQAFEILLKLGAGRHLYENAQNIHHVDVSQIFKKIENVEVKISFDVFAKYLKTTYSQDPLLANNIAHSLTRIVYDVARYGGKDVKSGKTAKEIVELVWNYIMTHPERPELERRLVEEFLEMDDTCSSGHALRILNTLSGFDGVSVKISFDKQVISNFIGRMDARFRQIPDSNPDKADILAEMIDEVKGIHYQKFFISNVGSLYTELQKEFVPEYLDQDSFDNSFRNAVAKYQGAHEIKGLDPIFKMQDAKISKGVLPSSP
mgnify:FL=1